MKIPIIRNEDNEPVGYDLIPETEEDYNNLGTIRNMVFFGFDDTAIKYDGREMSVDGSYESKDIKRLRFRKKSHKNYK